MTALAVPVGAARARVLIAADHLATRTGFRLALADSADCSEAVDAETAVEAAVRDQPDVCVVHFDPPGRAIRAVAAIASKVPRASVVVMTRHIDEEEFIAAVRAGAIGYLPEGVNPARLPYVVRSLMRGEAAVPRALVPRLIDELRGREGRRRHLDLPERKRVELTVREWEVVDLLRKGMSTRGIAELLGISAVTVRRHLSAVHGKLGIRSRAELLRLLATNGNEVGR
jgi:two-component system, NarL family, nitrate/nitrite response regulator NarL